MKQLEKEKIKRSIFESLPEYSCSYPTGQRVGKVWKRNWHFGTDKEPEWYICEYIDLPNDPEHIGIEHRIPVIIDG